MDASALMNIVASSLLQLEMHGSESMLYETAFSILCKSFVNSRMLYIMFGWLAEAKKNQNDEFILQQYLLLAAL